MPFTFTPEDGTGLAGANSYVTLVEATDYYAVDPVAAAAFAALANDAAREHRLAWATRILDQKTRWRGHKAVEASGLRWPRTYVCDRDGIAIEDDVVPRQVKEAVLELAKYLQTNDPTTEQDVEAVKRAKVDVLEIEYQDDTSQTTVPPIINQILSPLGYFQVGGSMFIPIVKS